jgi:glutamate synthase (NADPH) large chain
LKAQPKYGLPPKQGLYDPKFEKDACGVAFIAHIKGIASNQIVKDGLSMLCNLEHRGAVGADPKTGDGAGILLHVPDKFLRSIHGESLPKKSDYGVGNFFFPKNKKLATEIKNITESFIKSCGLEFISWRLLTVNNSGLGMGAKSCEPDTIQLIVGRKKDILPENFEMILYWLRKRIENKVESLKAQDKEGFYINSLSSKTIVYKGMLLSNQLEEYFDDLKNDLFESAIALVHQRFSTNTFPAWKLAHPFRYCAHNGEFNTIDGNINMMRAREYLMETDVLGENVQDLHPVIPEGLSDSASFDCAVELFLHTNRSLGHTLAMMIPEAWGSRKHMNPDRKSFYLYHANLLEPWDGPATLAACNGSQVAAILDRNGLRPARYCITKDDRIVFASESGTIQIPEKEIVYKNRLWPGKMIMIDMEKGTFSEDDEVKKEFLTKRPYQEWTKSVVELEDLPDPIRPPRPTHNNLKCFQRAFGYTEENLRSELAVMVENGQEGIGSMGNDVPLAVLSRQTKTLPSYFRQFFAQVTNPPIDPIREELVMGLPTYFGASWNVFEEDERFCRQLRLPQPIITNHQLEQIAQMNIDGLKGGRVSILFKYSSGLDGMKEAIQSMYEKAVELIDEGCNALILSDRDMDSKHAAIPVVLALSGLHHYLIKNKKRGNIGLIVETGEAKLVHDFAVLIGYGASAINPYLAYESIRELNDTGILSHIQDANDEEMRDAGYFHDRNYIKAINKGLMKIMSKMGISTIRSYKSAQIFEIIGFSQELVDEFFPGTTTQIGGIGLEEICLGALTRHRLAFDEQPDQNRQLEMGGELKWRPVGEHHLMNPESIGLLQHAAKSGNYRVYKKYSEKVDEQSYFLSTVRGLLKFKQLRPSIDIEEVEPISNIVKRFCTGAMSLGSISTEAHETLAVAMNELGGKSNTGEGGEDPRRFTPNEDGVNKCSAIKQVASGRFGVTAHYLANAREIQIKIAQGAKPGEGGQLPGHKVDDYIAGLRHSMPGVSLISPPPHHDIYSIEDLAQLIYDLKNSNPDADINVKLVAEAGVGTVAAGVAKAHAEVVTIAGHDGGTGASPISSIKHAGGPWELGLAETHQTLVLNNLRSRIRVQTDGQLRTGRDVVIAAMLGAEEFGFATVALVTMGCVMMRKCHLNTCPVGIATQDKRLIKYFKGQPQHVINYFTFLATEVREYMAELGFKSMNEMIGHTEYLEVNQECLHYKTKDLDLEKLLFKAISPDASPMYCVDKQDHNLGGILDQRLIKECSDAIEKGEKVELSMGILNSDRTAGTMLSGKIARKYGEEGLPEDTITVNFKGICGQSFGAFLTKGIKFHLKGEANDYLGKGMSGGTIIVQKDDESSLQSDINSIAGNTLLYGATGGKVFISGTAGERFGVRNSGVSAVVEGLGDHGCEYMTGGVIVVLGHTGRNFAAGMSGGIAYVIDSERVFSRRCNHGMVDIERLEDQKDYDQLKSLVQEHFDYTGSLKAKEILDNWEELKNQFVKIMPREYRRVLAQMNKRRG